MESVLEDNRDPEDESWFGRFAETLMTPLTDEGVASSVVPIIISGDPDSLARLEHMILDRPYSALAIELWAEAIGRLGTGLDVPREVLEGMSDPNHWGAWLVSDDTFRHHIEPQVITQVDAMSAGYLRVWMTAAEIPKYWVDRACIWYNPVDLISKPDPMANAVLLSRPVRHQRRRPARGRRLQRGRRPEHARVLQAPALPHPGLRPERAGGHHPRGRPDPRDPADPAVGPDPWHGAEGRGRARPGGARCAQAAAPRYRRPAGAVG